MITVDQVEDAIQVLLKLVDPTCGSREQPVRKAWAKLPAGLRLAILTDAANDQLLFTLLSFPGAANAILERLTMAERRQCQAALLVSYAVRAVDTVNSSIYCEAETNLINHFWQHKDASGQAIQSSINPTS